MNPGALLIRADASAAIGAGHVMRCVALAQGWQDAGGAAILAAAELPAALERRLLGEQVEVMRLQGDPGSVRDAEALANLARERTARWVVVDGERFGLDYFETLKQYDLKILWLDDFGSEHAREADLILNQNLAASREDYAWCGDPARLLLGTNYVTLRREFLQSTAAPETRCDARRLLVTFGGSDPDNLTEVALRALNSDPAGVEVTAIVGCANPRLPDLQRLATSWGVMLLADPPNLPELMRQSDLAVIAAGGTLWELFYCGCPVLSYSRNSIQANVIARLASAGAICDLGAVSDFSPAGLCAAIRRVAVSASERGRMRAAGHRVIDGNGVARVIRMLNGD